MKRNPRKPALDKKALWREIEKDARDRNRTVLAELRDRLRAARAKRAASITSAKSICRSAKLEARARARALESDAKAARSAARGSCDASKSEATTARAEVIAARTARDAELARQRDARHVARLARGRKTTTTTARERAQESDDEVRSNIPPELVSLFDRVRRQIKGSPRVSRTEMFLEYAESHPDEVYAAIDDQTDALIAELQRREHEEYERSLTRSNPDAGLIELGALTSLEYRPMDGGRKRTMRWSLSKAPILAYQSRGRGTLVVVYPVAVVGKSSAAAAKEYAKKHWGRAGAGERTAGDVALAPLDELGDIIAITYTTEKAGDADLVDYHHIFGDGAKGEWVPPAVLEHRCNAPRCAHAGRVALRGGTYSVTTHGIVG